MSSCIQWRWLTTSDVLLNHFQWTNPPNQFWSGNFHYDDSSMSLQLNTTNWRDSSTYKTWKKIVKWRVPTTDPMAFGERSAMVGVVAFIFQDKSAQFIIEFVAANLKLKYIRFLGNQIILWRSSKTVYLNGNQSKREKKTSNKAPHERFS